MSYLNFNKWIVIKENKDIFGFQKKIEKEIQNLDENPIKGLDSQKIIEHLLNFKLNEQYPFSNFSNQIQWGENTGSLRIIIGPMGSFKVSMRRLQEDLEGNKLWICKKIVPYQRFAEKNVNNEEDLANLLIEKIEKINENKFESANNNYKDLRQLVVNLARKCQKNDILPEVLIFKGIREVNEDNFLIYFECRGQGVEVPGFNRLEQFTIDMSYSKKRGTIRSIGYEILSPTRQHLWYPQTADWDEIFVPSQGEEIIECVLNAFKTY
jgi:hypothetical protein